MDLRKPVHNINWYNYYGDFFQWQSNLKVKMYNTTGRPITVIV